jgi:hypothetical protein
VAHGAGKRCQQEGCSKPAHSSSGCSWYCAAHVEGRRCQQQEGCPKSAHGSLGHCEGLSRDNTGDGGSADRTACDQQLCPAEESLPLVVLNKRPHKVISIALPGECLVCLEEFRPPELARTLLSCGHARVCYLCSMIRWKRYVSRKRTKRKQAAVPDCCPECRAEIRTEPMVLPATICL